MSGNKSKNLNRITNFSWETMPAIRQAGNIFIVERKTKSFHPEFHSQQKHPSKMITVSPLPASIMLCEISQAEKDKYHMISLICGI